MVCSKVIFNWFSLKDIFKWFSFFNRFPRGLVVLDKFPNGLVVLNIFSRSGSVIFDGSLNGLVW